MPSPHPLPNPTHASDALGMRLQPAAKDLVASVLPLTTHKRHRVRVAAIRAVGAIMHQGAHEMILEMVAFRWVSGNASSRDRELKRSVGLCGTVHGFARVKARLDSLP